MRKAPFNIERIPRPIRRQQLEQFDIEKESLERHVAEAKRRVRALLARDARILIMDLSQGDRSRVETNDEKLTQLVHERQFGSGDFTHGSIMRNIIGMDINDPRVTIWDVAREEQPANLPYPEAWDAWIATGGPAMPSELVGEVTPNTKWLERAVDAMKVLRAAHVPGVAVCLGHQLWEHSRGATVGRRHPQREIGTVTMRKPSTEDSAPDDIQLLLGFWDHNNTVQVSATHSEAVITPPPNPNIQVLMINGYSDYQGAAHPLRERQTVAEADDANEIVLSLQNHPEILALYLQVIRNLRGEQIRSEGINPDELVFSDTPQARTMWLNFIELVGRRNRQRS